MSTAFLFLCIVTITLSSGFVQKGRADNECTDTDCNVEFEREITLLYNEDHNRNNFDFECRVKKECEVKVAVIGFNEALRYGALRQIKKNEEEREAQFGIDGKALLRRVIGKLINAKEYKLTYQDNGNVDIIFSHDFLDSDYRLSIHSKLFATKVVDLKDKEIKPLVLNLLNKYQDLEQIYEAKRQIIYFSRDEFVESKYWESAPFDMHQIAYSATDIFDGSTFKKWVIDELISEDDGADSDNKKRLLRQSGVKVHKYSSSHSAGNVPELFNKPYWTSKGISMEIDGYRIDWIQKPPPTASLLSLVWNDIGPVLWGNSYPILPSHEVTLKPTTVLAIARSNYDGNFQSAYFRFNTGRLDGRNEHLFCRVIWKYDGLLIMNCEEYTVSNGMQYVPVMTLNYNRVEWNLQLYAVE